MDIFISESFRRGHEPPDMFKQGMLKAIASLATISDEGTESYYDTSNLRKLISKSSGVETVIFGTDFDAQGTKVASLYKLTSESMGVKRNIRMSFTKDGYMKIGGFYDRDRLVTLLKMDKFNQLTAQNLRKEGIYAGYRTATVIGKVKQLKSQGDSVKVKSKGTNTVTYLVKSAMAGIPVKKALAKLIGAYEKGEVRYPRVDGDYHLDDPYDLYAHPKLAEIDEYATPIEASELELTKETVLLALSNERLITPSMAEYYWEKIDQYYDDDLNVRKGKEEEVSLMEKIANAFEEVYKEDLKTHYKPSLPMIIKPEPSLSSSDNKDKEKLLEEAWMLQCKIEEERRRKKAKEKEQEDYLLMKKIKRSMQILEDSAEGDLEKNKFRRAFRF